MSCFTDLVGAAIARREHAPGLCLGIVDHAFATLEPSKEDAAYGWCVRGEALELLDRLDEAIEMGWRAVSDAATYFDAVNLLARCYEARGDLAMAERCWRLLSRTRPTAESWKCLGNFLRENDRPQEAIEAYAQSERLDPRRHDVQHNWGLLLFEQGDHVAAARRLWRALVLAPRDRRTLGLLAAVEEAQLELRPGSEQDARARWVLELRRRAVESDPADAQAWADLAFAHYRLKQHRQTRYCARRAEDLEPDEPRWAEMLARYALQRPGMARTALPHAARALQLEETADRWVWVGQALFELGRESEAMVALEIAEGFEDVDLEDLVVSREVFRVLLGLLAPAERRRPRV